MDPLSIFTCVTFCIQATASLYQTIDELNSHRRDVVYLKTGLGEFNVILQVLGKKINNSTNDFKVLSLVLLRCGQVCEEFETSVLDSVKRSKSSVEQSKAWTKLQFLGSDINNFRNLISSYKATVMIALTNHNFQASEATRRVIKKYVNLIDDTTASLEEQIAGLSRKLELLRTDQQNELSSEHYKDTDHHHLAVQQALNEKISLERCLVVCAKVSDHVERVKLEVRSNRMGTGATLESWDPDEETVSVEPQLTVSDILAANDAEQIMVATGGDLIFRKGIRLGPNSQDIHGAMSENSLRALSQSMSKVAVASVQKVVSNGRNGHGSTSDNQFMEKLSSKLSETGLDSGRRDCEPQAEHDPISITQKLDFRVLEEPYSNSTINKLKLAMENLFQQQIVWWPLREPSRPPGFDQVRYAWNCVGGLYYHECGEEVYLDLPRCNETQQWSNRYLRQHDQDSKDPGLPTPVTNSPSGSAWGTLWSASAFTVRKAIRSVYSRSATIGVSPVPAPGRAISKAYVYWCVRSQRNELVLNEIAITKNETKDWQFAHELRRKYRETRGWNHHLTSTDFSDVFLGGFARIPTLGSGSHTLVTPITLSLPIKHAEYDFEFSPQVYGDGGEAGELRLMQHIKGMLDHLVVHGCTGNRDSVIRHVPKLKAKLMPSVDTAYGLHAESKVAYWKLCHLLWFSPSAVFAVLVLRFKPDWDLQTATVPFFGLCTLLALRWAILSPN